MGRTYGEDLWCVMKHDGLAKIHFHETLEKLYRNEPDHPSIPIIEQQIRDLDSLDKTLIKKYGKMSKQEDYSCSRCDEDLGAKIQGNPYKEEQSNNIINVNSRLYGENKMVNLNPIKALAKKSRIPQTTIENTFGGEVLGAATDMLLDIPFTTFGAKLAKGVAGLSELLLVAFGNKIGTRAKALLMQSAAHLLVEAFDPTMEEIADMVSGSKVFTRGLQNKSIEQVKASIIKPKEQLATEYGSLASTLKGYTSLNGSTNNDATEIIKESKSKIFGEPVEKVKSTVL